CQFRGVLSQVHHGGFFVGHGHLRAYVNWKVNWFDHVEMDTWSPLWLGQFVEDLGYLTTGTLNSTLLSEMTGEASQPSMLSQPQGQAAAAAAAEKRKVTKNTAAATNKKRAGASANKKKAGDGA
ncbi:hypothetical protein EJB05_15703, partial [Eragrostis curvula]